MPSHSTSCGWARSYVAQDFCTSRGWLALAMAKGCAINQAELGSHDGAVGAACMDDVDSAMSTRMAPGSMSAPAAGCVWDADSFGHGVHNRTCNKRPGLTQSAQALTSQNVARHVLSEMSFDGQGVGHKSARHMD